MDTVILVVTIIGCTVWLERRLRTMVMMVERRLTSLHNDLTPDASEFHRNDRDRWVRHGSYDPLP